MSALDLLICGAVALILSWRVVPLRIQGVMVAAAGALSGIGAVVPMAHVAMLHIAIDLAGACVGLAIHWRWPGHNGLIFFGLSLAALISTAALFISDSLGGGLASSAVIYWYKSAAIVIYILSCLSIGGRGFAWLHRHCRIGAGGHHSADAVGSRG